jgi:hypothetical protein
VNSKAMGESQGAAETYIIFVFMSRIVDGFAIRNALIPSIYLQVQPQ